MNWIVLMVVAVIAVILTLVYCAVSIIGDEDEEEGPRPPAQFGGAA